MTGQELKEIEKINKTREAQLAAQVLSNQGEILATDGSYLIQLMLWGKDNGENWEIGDSQIDRVDVIEEALVLLEPKQIVEFSTLLDEIITLDEMKKQLKAGPGDLAAYLFVNSEGCLYEMNIL